MPIMRTKTNKLLLAVLLITSALALAIYWAASSTAIGQIIFWILVVLDVVLVRHLLGSEVLPRPVFLARLGLKWDIKSLVIGLACFPAAIAWGACLAFGLRRGAIPDTVSAVSLLLLPCAVLVVAGGFFLFRGLWGKDH